MRVVGELDVSHIEEGHRATRLFVISEHGRAWHPVSVCVVDNKRCILDMYASEGGMDKGVDILVKSLQGLPTLVVEVKAREGESPDWAIRLRRNLVAHSWISAQSYFLLVTPNKFYLWSPSASEDPARSPDFKVDADVIFSRDSRDFKNPSERLSEESLQVLVASWLNDVTRAKRSEIGPCGSWLIESGLYDAIRDGTVLLEPAA